MKKLMFSLSIAFLAAFSLTGCDSNSPKPVAEKFLNAFWHLDYKEAKTVSTDMTKDLLDMLEQLSATMPDSVKKQAKDIKVNIKDVKEEGDKAIVTFTTSQMKEEKQINLVKQNGQWLVNLSKNDDFSEQPADAATPPDVGRNEADAAAEGDTVKKQ